MNEWIAALIGTAVAAGFAVWSIVEARRARGIAEAAQQTAERALRIEEDRRADEIRQARHRSPNLEAVPRPSPQRGFEICNGDILNADIEVAVLPPGLADHVTAVELDGVSYEASPGLNMTAALPAQGSVRLRIIEQHKESMGLRILVRCDYSDGTSGEWRYRTSFEGPPMVY